MWRPKIRTRAATIIIMVKLKEIKEVKRKRAEKGIGEKKERKKLKGTDRETNYSHWFLRRKLIILSSQSGLL
jgi:hypothetical protein